MIFLNIGAFLRSTQVFRLNRLKAVKHLARHKLPQ
jgi:hypothetical protein